MTKLSKEMVMLCQELMKSMSTSHMENFPHYLTCIFCFYTMVCVFLYVYVYVFACMFVYVCVYVCVCELHTYIVAFEQAWGVIEQAWGGQRTIPG